MMMRFIQICLALGIITLTPLAFGQSHDLLVCRGGGSLDFNFKNSLIIITFTQGMQEAGPQWNKISAGECSFQDRALQTTEPYKIKRRVKNFSIDWTRNRVGRIFPKDIEVLQDPNKFQSFHVEVDGQGHFVVKKIGESRDR
jgi:hypothetical protein